MLEFKIYADEQYISSVYTSDQPQDQIDIEHGEMWIEGLDVTGATDCSAAFNAAIEAWAALGSNPSVVVRIPKGTFLVNSTVYWGRCPVLGAGVGATLIKPGMTDGSFAFTFDEGRFSAAGFTVTTGVALSTMAAVSSGQLGYCGGVRAGVFNGAEVRVTFDAGTSKVLSAAHPFSNGDGVSFSPLGTSSALPTTMTSSQRYYVVNREADKFQLATSRGGTPIALGGASGTSLAACSSNRGRLDIRISGCYYAFDSSGWINDIKIFAENCFYAPRLSHQNGNIIDIVVENCLHGKQFSYSAGSHISRVLSEGNEGKYPPTGSNAFNGMLGVAVNALYCEESANVYRDTPHYRWGETSINYGHVVNGVSALAAGTENGVPSLLFDKMAGGWAAGNIGAGSADVRLPRIGAEVCCFDPSNLVARGEGTAVWPYGLQAPFEVLQGAGSCAFNPVALNPLPYFEHRGGHIYEFVTFPATSATTEWVESSRIPGTWAMRVKSTHAPGSNRQAYMQLRIKKPSAMVSLDGKCFLAVAIVNIPDIDAYGSSSKNDDLNHSLCQPGIAFFLKDANGNNVTNMGVDISIGARQHHRRGTIQAYASFIDTTRISTEPAEMFGISCYSARNSPETAETTEAYIDVDALFVFEVPNSAVCSALLSHAFRTDIRTLNADSVMQGGRLITNNQFYGGTSSSKVGSAYHYSVGDTILLTPAMGISDRKICTVGGIAGTGTGSATFVNGAELFDLPCECEEHT